MATPRLSRDELERLLSVVEVLQSCYPLEGELEVPLNQLDALRHLAKGADDPGRSLSDGNTLALRLRVELEADHQVVVEIVFSLRAKDGVIGPPTITVLQPPFLTAATYRALISQLAEGPEGEEEPTALVLDYVQRLQESGPALLPANSVASTRSSFEDSVGDLISSTASLALEATDSMSKELLICVSKMHHIRSMSKFKKLKNFALEHGVSGYAKTGRPGVLLYEVEGKQALAKFLESVRGLKYLEFHHLAAASQVPADAAAPALPNGKRKPWALEKAAIPRLNAGAPGFQEVEDTKELLGAADSVGRKEWLRSALGMTGKGG